MISQSVGALAVLSLLSTSVALANPTATVPANTTTTTATASSVAPATSTTATDASAADAADVAQGGPLADVPAGHWAYDAVAQLVKDGLIVGYPDGQFKGNRPMTRYEAAVLTYRAVDQIEAQITAGKAVAQADIDAVKKLIAAFGKELKDVEAHVAALQKTVDIHSKALTDLKAEADATQLRVNQGKIGFNEMARPGTSSFVLNGTTATGATLATGSSVKFGSGSQNTATIGALNTGIMYNLARIYLGGQLDPRWSYGARISDAIKYSPFEATSTSPAYCAGGTGVAPGQNCAYTVLNYNTTPEQNTLPINLDYAFVGYSSPGGITSQIGRYSVGAYGKFGTTPWSSMLFGGQAMTGANLGYNDPHGHLYAAFYYGQQAVNTSVLATATSTYSAATGLTTVSSACTGGVYGLNATAPGQGVAGQGSFTGINPYCNSPQNEEGMWAVYYLDGPRVALGGAFDNVPGKLYSFYNPNAVTCTVAAGPTKGAYQAASPALCAANFPTATLSAPTNYYVTGQGLVQDVEGYAAAWLGSKKLPQFLLQADYSQHIGVNPFTGGAFNGGDAETFAVTFASKGNLFAGGGYTNPWITGGGRRNSNVVGLYVGRFGVNSLSNIENTDLGGSVPFANNLGLTSLNGVQVAGVQAAHWVSDSIRFGLNAFHLQNLSNTTGTSGIPIAAPVGGNAAFINQINENQLNAEMYMYFF
jgi:hypothetical protein